MRQADVGQQRDEALLLHRFRRTARDLSVCQHARACVAPGAVGPSTEGRRADGVTPARVGLACETRREGWDKLSDRHGLAPAALRALNPKVRLAAGPLTLRLPVDATERPAASVRAGGTATRGRGRTAAPPRHAPLAALKHDTNGEHA